MPVPESRRKPERFGDKLKGEKIRSTSSDLCQAPTCLFCVFRNNVPKICFINKMDKHNARFNYCLKSIESKLNVVPIVTQTPIGQGKSFQGFVDLPSLKVCLWTEQESTDKSWGSQYDQEALDISVHGGEVFEKAHEARAVLIDQLCDYDEEMSEMVLESENYDQVTAESIQKTLRKICLLYTSPSPRDRQKSRMPSSA